MAIPHGNGQLTRPRAAVGMTAVAQPVVRYFVQLQFSGVWSGCACICVSIPQDWGLSQVLMLEISKCPEVSNNLEAVAIWGCKIVVCTGVAVWVSKSCLRFLMYPKQLRENRKITGICLWNTSCGSRNLKCRKTDSLFVTLGTSSSECTVTTWSTGSKLCTAAKKRRVIWVNLQQLHQKKVNGSVNITRVASDKFQSCFFGPENSTGASDDPSMTVRLCRELVDTDDSGKKISVATSFHAMSMVTVKSMLSKNQTMYLQWLTLPAQPVLLRAATAQRTAERFPLPHMGYPTSHQHWHVPWSNNAYIMRYGHPTIIKDSLWWTLPLRGKNHL